MSGLCQSPAQDSGRLARARDQRMMALQVVVALKERMKQ